MMKGGRRRKSGPSQALTPHVRQGWNWWTRERHRQQKRQPLSPINTDRSGKSLQSCCFLIDVILTTACGPKIANQSCIHYRKNWVNMSSCWCFNDVPVQSWLEIPIRRTPACWCIVRLFSPHHFVMMYRQWASCGLSNLKRSQEKERAPKCWKKGPFCAQGTASNTGNEHKFAVSCPASESAVPRSASLPRPLLPALKPRAKKPILKFWKMCFLPLLPCSLKAV